MQSPNMLKKEHSSVAVTRLNNYPIAMAVIIGMVIFLTCYYAIHKKMQQIWSVDYLGHLPSL